MARKPPTVAEYLTAQIDVTGKSQLEIAQECGFTSPNVITMIKQGKTKLPLSRVGALAKALGVDPVYLFSLAMNEYEPGTWSAMEGLIFKQPLLTANELEFVQVLRSGKVQNPRLRTAHDKARLLALVNQLDPE